MSVQTAFSECTKSLESDWFQLSGADKVYFLELAKAHGYRDPKSASGRSKGYCFYLALQRIQNRKEKQK